MVTTHVDTLYLRTGQAVLVRPLEREDAPALARAVQQMSAHSRYRRFHTGLSQLSDDMLATLTDIDHHDHEALIALHPAAHSGAEIVGLARFVRAPAHIDTAEVAVGVADLWQRRGLATLLLRQLAQHAASIEINHFTATVLVENAPTIALLKQLGATRFTRDGSELFARMHPADWADQPDVPHPPRRVPDQPAVVLIPRLLRAWLGVSSDLTRTMTFPISAALRRGRDHNKPHP